MSFFVQIERISISIAFMFLFVWQSSAQVMVIHQKGQPDIRIPIGNIVKLTFDLSGTTGAIQPGAIKKIKTTIANILPNPFSTRIEYTIDKPAMVSIRVIDMQGRIVRTITKTMMNIGQYTTTWNARDDAGQKVGNASYIVNVEINGQSVSKSLFIVN
jgi:hypothetical protein